MGRKIRLTPEIGDIIQYGKTVGVKKEYKEVADTFVNCALINAYSCIDNELNVGDDILWGANSSGEIILTDGDSNKVFSIDEIAEKYKSNGGLVVKQLLDGVMFELYSALLITENGGVREYANMNYPEVCSVMKEYKDYFSQSNECKAIEAFINRNIALPATLIKELDIMSENVKSNKDKENVQSNLGDAYEYFWNSESYLCKLCKSEYTMSSVVELGYMYARMAKFLAEHGMKSISTIEKLLQATSKEIMYVRVGDVERLATKKEIKSLVSGVYKKRVYMIDTYKIKLLQCVWWLTSGDKKYARFAGLEKRENDFLEIEANIAVLRKAIAWMTTKEFIDEDVKDIFEGTKEINYPENVSDELQLDTKLSTVKMLKFVKENVDRADSYGSLAYDIASQALKDKKHRLSEKQYLIIKRQYELLNGKKDEPKLNSEIKDIMKELSTKYYSMSSKIVKSIIEYANEHNYCSEKQEKVLREELNKYREAESGEKTVKERKVRKERSVGGVTQSDLEVANVAKIFGISFDAAEISNSLGRKGVE